MAPKTHIRETYLVTIERPRLVSPDTVQEDLRKVVTDNCLCKLVTIVNQDDVLRKR